MPRNIIWKIKPLKQYTQPYGKTGHIALLYTIPLEQNKLFLYSVNCHTGEGPILHRRNPKLQAEKFSVCIACLNIVPDHSKFLFKFTRAHTNVSVLAPPPMQDLDSQPPSSITSNPFPPPANTSKQHKAAVCKARKSRPRPARHTPLQAEQFGTVVGFPTEATSLSHSSLMNVYISCLDSIAKKQI